MLCPEEVALGAPDGGMGLDVMPRSASFGVNAVPARDVRIAVVSAAPDVNVGPSWGDTTLEGSLRFNVISTSFTSTPTEETWEKCERKRGESALIGTQSDTYSYIHSFTQILVGGYVVGTR